MAKKRRTVRPPRSASPTRYGQGSGPAPAAESTPNGTRALSTSRPSARASRAAAQAKAAVAVNYGEEYHYVALDLRRVAYLAVGLFAILAVLSLVIR